MVLQNTLKQILMHRKFSDNYVNGVNNIWPKVIVTWQMLLHYVAIVIHVTNLNMYIAAAANISSDRTSGKKSYWNVCLCVKEYLSLW